MSQYSESECIDLIRLRYFQHQINEMLKLGLFKVPIHLAIGHEAVAVAMDGTMKADDVLSLSHRNAAFNLARTKSLAGVLKHYQLESQAAAIGQMGSMNLAMDGAGIVYTSSILGNNLAVSAGIALNRKLLKRTGIVFVATGDGALEEGVFWETMVFARSHSLKLVIVVENNDHSMSSTIAQRRSPIDLSLVCAGLGVAYFDANGASLASSKAALASARISAAVNKVALVEIKVKSFCQHAGPTPGWPSDPLQIALSNGLLMVGENTQDPLADLAHVIGAAEFDRLCTLVMTEGAV